MCCCLYPRNSDCCPADPHAWKRVVKMCAPAPPPADIARQQSNLSAICHIHGCNDNMLECILLQNIIGNICNDSSLNIWDESIHVPLCENCEKHQFTSSWDNKCQYTTQLRQPRMTKTKNVRELIKELLKSHPAGYKYACKCDRIKAECCKCKRKRF